MVTNVGSLEITEFDSNPQGSDSGNEWIEIFSKTEIDLSDYLLENGDGDILELNGIFTGYFVINLEKQWLDNSDEKVILKKLDELIDETPVLSDSKNSDLSFSICNGEWSLKQNTKGEKNLCNNEKINSTNYLKDIDKIENQISEDENSKISVDLSDNIKDSEKNTIQGSFELDGVPIQPDLNDNKIKLNSKKSENSDFEPIFSREYKKRMWILYGFTGLCILIIFGLAWNKL